MLKGKGFEQVYNLSGGIKAWHGEVAHGDEDLGLELFSGTESAESFLVIAYSLEMGLQDFYLSMAKRVADQTARDLFQKLADIEIIHRKRIYEAYLKITGQEITQNGFEQSTVTPMIEGGLSTEEYLERFDIDKDSATEVVSLAMSIEAQALDLYQRLGDRSGDSELKEAALQTAREERTHLAHLARLMDDLHQ